MDICLVFSWCCLTNVQTLGTPVLIIVEWTQHNGGNGIVRVFWGEIWEIPNMSATEGGEDSVVKAPECLL